MTRLARALNSDDLGHYETDCDSDVLQATGAAAIKGNLGVLILEAKEGSAGTNADSVARIKDLEAALIIQVKRMARRWSVRVDVEGVAAKVAKELILDRCVLCQGRGFIPMKYDGTRLVGGVEDEGDKTKDVECTTCLGSGQARRDYHGRTQAAGWSEYTKQLGEWWEAILNSCCDAELNARAAIWRKLKSHRI